MTSNKLNLSNLKKSDQKYSQFIARINCEGDICPDAYATSLPLLEKMILVKFNQDTMVVPPESSHFGYYVPGQDHDIVDMTQLPVYTENRIGLKEMNENGKIIFLDTGKGSCLELVYFSDKIIKTVESD